ncbi:MAG: substrate-binding domain-containing protein [Verrucomicrobiota bacterium]
MASPYAFFSYLIVVLFSWTSLLAQPREIWASYRIAIIAADGEAASTKAVEAGARQVADKLEKANNLAITLDNLSTLESSAEAQRRALHRAFLEGYDGVLLNVADAATIVEEIELLSRQGIPVVTFERDVPGSARLATIVNDEIQAGKLAAEAYLAQLKFVRGEVGILAGQEDNPIMQQRLDGIRQKLEPVPSVTLHEPLAYSGETVTNALGVLNEAIRKDHAEDIRGWIFLGNWPVQSGQPLPWVSEDNAVCIVIDADPHVIPYMLSGQVQAAVATDYFGMGEAAMSRLIKTIHHQAHFLADTVIIEPKVITQEKLGQFQRDWTDWLQR